MKLMSLPQGLDGIDDFVGRVACGSLLFYPFFFVCQVFSVHLQNLPEYAILYIS